MPLDLRMMTNVKLRTKLIGLFVGLSMPPFLALGWYANWVASNALRDCAFGGISSLRDSTSVQLEQYLHSLTTFTTDVAEYQSVTDALAMSGVDGTGGRIAEGLQQLKKDLRVSDMYLIDPAGDVVFSFAKLADSGTNLLNGEFKDSPLAAVFRAATKQPATADMAWYAPAGAPLAFVAGPVADAQGTLRGVVALAVGEKQINAVMGAQNGKDAARETYLVGPDFLMRSDARQDPTHRSVIASFKNQAAGKIESRSVKDALAGKVGTLSDVNYVGKDVISAYQPVEAFGAKWALIAETDEDQAFSAIRYFRNSVWASGLLGMMAIVVIGFWFARYIGLPIHKIVSNLSATSSQIAATIDEQDRMASQQSAAVSETSTTMAELDASSRRSAEQADAAAAGATRALEAATRGREALGQSLEGMGALQTKVQQIAGQILRLSEQTSQIESITRLVSNLANQTNLLALNAAVEAARAGEHGKGFAVVAAEIRKLADESKRSTERISALVAEIQNATNATVMVTEEGTKMVEQGARLAQRAADGFGSVIDTSMSAAENAQQINLNVKQQAAAMSQVVEAMRSLSEGSRETAAGLSQTRLGIQTLNEAAQGLRALV